MARDWQSLNEYTLFCRGRLANPYPLYHQLRSEDPVHWSHQANSWILTRYDDVRFALQHDPRLTAERLSLLLAQLPREVQAEVEPLRRLLSTWMQYYDPPDHTRLRSLVNRAFTPGTLERLRPRIEAIAEDLLQAVRARGRLDVIAEFAYPLPAIAIAELLGVPPEDRDRFKRWADDLTVFMEGVGSDYPAIARRTNRSVLELTHYLGGLFDQRRRHPRADLISDLIAVEAGGDRLSQAELFGICSFLLEAGHETTTGLIGNGLLALLRHPDQLRKLQQNPALIAPAVEECLRYDGPIQRISRVVIADLRTARQKASAGTAHLGHAGRRQPGPATVPRARPLRHPPPQQPARGLRVRRPSLSGSAPGPHRRANRLPRPAAAAGIAAGESGAGVAGGRLAAHPEVAAGPVQGELKRSAWISRRVGPGSKRNGHADAHAHVRAPAAFPPNALQFQVQGVGVGTTGLKAEFAWR